MNATNRPRRQAGDDINTAPLRAAAALQRHHADRYPRPARCVTLGQSQTCCQCSIGPNAIGTLRAHTTKPCGSGADPSNGRGAACTYLQQIPMEENNQSLFLLNWRCGPLRLWCGVACRLQATQSRALYRRGLCWGQQTTGSSEAVGASQEEAGSGGGTVSGLPDGWEKFETLPSPTPRDPPTNSCRSQGDDPVAAKTPRLELERRSRSD